MTNQIHQKMKKLKHSWQLCNNNIPWRWKIESWRNLLHYELVHHSHTVVFIYACSLKTRFTNGGLLSIEWMFFLVLVFGIYVNLWQENFSSYLGELICIRIIINKKEVWDIAHLYLLWKSKIAYNNHLVGRKQKYLTLCKHIKKCLMETKH